MPGPWESYQTQEPTQTGQFETKLTPVEETQFQTWKSKNAPKDSGADYDLRGAFKAGLTPDPKTGHWADTFKKPNHPTFSNESKYSTPENPGGHWEGNKFVPQQGATQEQGPWTDYGDSPPVVAPAPFPIDEHIRNQVKDMSPEDQTKAKEGWASALHEFAKPYLALNYGAMLGVNEGITNFAVSLDLWTKNMERRGVDRSGFFGKCAKEYEANSDYWRKLIEKEGFAGINKLYQIVGEGIGGFVPGTSDWLLDIGTLLYKPYVTAKERAIETGDPHPVIAGMIEAGKTGTLGLLFKSIAPLNRYLKATILGTTFGAQGLMEAPEGKKAEGLVRGTIMGGGLGLVSPPGGAGIKDIYSKPSWKDPRVMKALWPDKVPGAKDEIVPGLKPAIRTGEKVTVGNEGETHADVLGRMEKGPAETGEAATPLPGDVNFGDMKISKKPRKENIVETKELEEGLKTVKSVEEDGKLITIQLLDNKGEVVGGISKYKGIDGKEYIREIGLVPELRGGKSYALLRDQFPGIEGGKSVSLASIKAKAKYNAAKVGEGPKISEPEPEHVFSTPDGKILDREEAKAYVKENEPEVYAWWETRNGSDAEFHTADYNEAKETAAGKIIDPDIADLTRQLRRVSKDSSFEDTMSLADKTKQLYTGVLGKAKTAVTSLKGTSEAAWNWYKSHAVKWTSIDELIGRYTGARQISDMKVARFVKEMQGSMSNREQNAMSIWLEANGDEGKIKEWSQEPLLKQAAEDALRFNDEQKGFAQNIRAYWDRKLDEAIDAGILEHGIENYVTHIVEKSKDNPIAKRFVSEASAGVFKKNPSFAKKRIHETFFDLVQSGLRPKDMRLGYLLSQYQKSFDEAINARAFIKELSDAITSDGQPATITMGTGKTLSADEQPSGGWLIKPRGVSSDVNTADYEIVDHPALRRWKWTAKDNEGKPIFVEGDLLVHKEFAGKLKKLLGPSWFSGEGITPAIGRAALKGSSVVKGTLLGFFSAFHQVHLGVRSVTRLVSPFSPGAIELDEPLTKALIEHDLEVYDGRPTALFNQGFNKSNLISYVPGLGKLANHYTEYLFGTDGYVPRLKTQLAKELYARNREHYPKLSEDQVLVLSANQANAAIGGQNWEALGASKTTQDVLRLTGLAPDFLISSWRAKGQAFAPYGREQFTAIALRGTIGIFLACKIIEGIASTVDDKNKIHLDKPFSVTLDGKEFSIRSEQGDILNAIRDPRNFLYSRLNPGIAKPTIEAITGRDNWGRKRDVLHQLQDWATSAVPIAGQGLFTRGDYELYQSILASMGVSSWNARTEAEKLIRELSSEKDKSVKEPATQERISTRATLAKNFAENKDLAPIKQALTEGKITYQDVEGIFDRAIKGDVARGVASFTMSEALQVWGKTNDEEKAAIQPILLRKWFSWQATVDERMPLEKQMEEVLSWRAPEKGKKTFWSRFTIREK